MVSYGLCDLKIHSFTENIITINARKKDLAVCALKFTMNKLSNQVIN